MNASEQSILNHAMSGRRLSRREIIVAKTLQHLPHLGLSIPGRRRSSEQKDRKVGEDETELVVDSAIGASPVHLTELPAQNHTPTFSTILKADELGTNAPVSACDSDESPSVLATPYSGLEATTRSSAISIADFLNSREPVGASDTHESPSARYAPGSGLETTSSFPAISNEEVLGLNEPVVASTTYKGPSALLTRPPKLSRKRSLFALVPKMFRPRSRCTTSQHGRLPDSPPVLVLNPMALEELWTCPDYFFKRQMPSRGINPQCKYYEDRSSMDEIFYLDMEESRTSPGLMVCMRRGPQYMYGAVDTEVLATTSCAVELEGSPLLPSYSTPTPPPSRPKLLPSSLSIHCDPEEIERDTFTNPFDVDREEEEEREDLTEPHMSPDDSSFSETDSIATELSLHAETGISTRIKRAMRFASDEDCERRHSLPL